MLRYQKRDNNIYPSFVSVTDSSLINICQNLNDTFARSIKKQRCELEEQLQEQFSMHRALSPRKEKIVIGLKKLFFDRCTFDDHNFDEFQAFREKIFLTSSMILSKNALNDYQDYQFKISDTANISIDDIQSKIYSDLPEFQCIQGFEPMSPEKMLHRYNCALVQGLLVYAREIKILLSTTDSGLLRQLFKYLRFYRLLAYYEKIDAQYQIIIDGPLQVIQQSSQYGIRLSQLFPAILLLPAWELEAIIQKPKQKAMVLKIDHNINIQSHYYHFINYTPPEIEWFFQSFQKEMPDWKIEENQDFLHIEKEQTCFPDYTLIHKSGKLFFLEIFHPWHAKQLKERTASLNKNNKYPLILAASKKITQMPELKKSLQNNEYFQRFGFLYREFPLVETLKEVLEKNLLSVDS